MFKVQVFGSAHFHLSPPHPPLSQCKPQHQLCRVEQNKPVKPEANWMLEATDTTFSSSTSLDIGQSVLRPFDVCRDKSGTLLLFRHKPVTTACTTVHFFGTAASFRYIHWCLLLATTPHWTITSRNSDPDQHTFHQLVVMRFVPLAIGVLDMRSLLPQMLGVILSFSGTTILERRVILPTVQYWSQNNPETKAFVVVSVILWLETVHLGLWMEPIDSFSSQQVTKPPD